MQSGRSLALSGMGWIALTGALFSQTLGEAVTNGTVSAQLRLSLEQAEVAGNETGTATALNLRTRLGYRTGAFAETAAFLQFQDVSAIVRDYAPLDSEFDTVADPESASLHQAYLEYGGAPGTQARLGRQEIALDDHRLIGNVDWRQQGQSFDAIAITNRSLDDLTLFLGAISRVLTPAGTFLDLDRLLLLQADWRGIEGHLIGLHGYWLDSPGGEDEDRDSATYGARIAGDPPAAEYALDYHQQAKYADATAGGGSMTNAFAAAKFAGFRLGLGYGAITGVQGGDHAFDTLFSTAHAHNGWADQFISTNGGGLANGLKDAYALLGGNHGGVRWEIAYHRFDQETRSEPYGTEVDLLATMPLAENLTGLLKAARYTADGGNTSGVAATDKSVYWARLDYKF